MAPETELTVGIIVECITPVDCWAQVCQYTLGLSAMDSPLASSSSIHDPEWAPDLPLTLSLLFLHKTCSSLLLLPVTARGYSNHRQCFPRLFFYTSSTPTTVIYYLSPSHTHHSPKLFTHDCLISVTTHCLSSAQIYPENPHPYITQAALLLASLPPSSSPLIQP